MTASEKAFLTELVERATSWINAAAECLHKAEGFRRQGQHLLCEREIACADTYHACARSLVAAVTERADP